MAKTDFKNVREYIASHPPPVRRALTRVRSAVRKGMPDAEEAISYQIPAYKIDGHAVLYFAGWKEHYSLYPSTRRMIATFKDDLARYQVSKGTIRFPLSEPVPAALIAAIAKFRATEVREPRQKTTGAAKKR